MDFAKACNKVHHKRLLHKLEYYGINIQINNRINAFLVISGVPQGSVFMETINLAFAPKVTRNVTYKTIDRPQHEYASCIWNPYTDIDTGMVEKSSTYSC